MFLLFTDYDWQVYALILVLQAASAHVHTGFFRLSLLTFLIMRTIEPKPSLCRDWVMIPVKVKTSKSLNSGQ